MKFKTTAALTALLILAALVLGACGSSATSLGNSTDHAFLRMMVPHHTGAIAMARVELAKGFNAELKALARRIISAQEREVRAMRVQAS